MARKQVAIGCLAVTAFTGTGCSAGLQAIASGAQAVARPVPVASTAAANPSTAAKVISDGGVAYALPTTVTVKLPATLLSSQGGAVVSENGSGVISNNGGSALGSGRAARATFHLLQATPTAGLPASLQAFLQNELATYIQFTTQIDDLLAKALTGQLKPGIPVMQPDPSNPQWRAVFTLAALSDHARLEIANGPPGAEQQTLGLAFNSPRLGHAVVKDPTHAGALSLAFNLDAGTVIADGAVFQGGLRVHRHWELTAWPNPQAGSPAFSLSVASRVENDQNAQQSMVSASLTNFLADGSAAGLVAMVDHNTQGTLQLVPGPFAALAASMAAGPNSSPPPGITPEHFMAADGHDLYGADASAALHAIAPSAQTVLSTLPPEIGPGNPVESSVFDFPQ